MPGRLGEIPGFRHTDECLHAKQTIHSTSRAPSDRHPRRRPERNRRAPGGRTTPPHAGSAPQCNEWLDDDDTTNLYECIHIDIDRKRRNTFGRRPARHSKNKKYSIYFIQIAKQKNYRRERIVRNCTLIIFLCIRIYFGRSVPSGPPSGNHACSNCP
ncbi:hypothetical protein AvCA_26400 [Azotobacter vinelandii CA]|uniref:Uncharacterized protein n=2 Tax=Azotobacter vinelandii TaxID=354 RepID=C1DJP7_AZOVD|nr:hypothetical protein Avin_26400 [Azotobacter vinelandii DJ]AGK14895.1 hypothetical protein AvCA_26400 [Azotobacter vinelandii CA]AGK20769.1 hypothetical protein AvCA6_26400 [Azotobacter vinelandii CA6]